MASRPLLRAAQTLGHADQLSKRSSFHLVHEATTMEFDGGFGDPYFGSDLLVDESAKDTVHYFPFARGERFVPLVEFRPLAFGASFFLMSVHGLANSVK